MFDHLWKLLTFDIGVDLGTANIRVGLTDKGVVIYEPSVVAINKSTKEILAVGKEARTMIGRTPSSVIAIRPLKDGVITDFEITLTMMKYFINKVHSLHNKSFKIPRPRIVIGVPSAITEVEKQAVIDAAKAAGAREAYIVEEPMAAAIGIGLPIEEPIGSMIIDIGGGTTDIAIISLGGIIIDKTIKIAGDEMNDEIVNYFKENYSILIGPRMAEDLKISIGSAYPLKEEKNAIIQGRSMIDGLPKAIKITSVEIREALQRPLTAISNAVQEALEDCPPELVSDIYQKGIFATGGGSNLLGLDKYIQSIVKVSVKTVEDPGLSVVKGTLTILQEIELLKKLKENDELLF